MEIITMEIIMEISMAIIMVDFIDRSNQKNYYVYYN